MTVRLSYHAMLSGKKLGRHPAWSLFLSSDLLASKKVRVELGCMSEQIVVILQGQEMLKC